MKIKILTLIVSMILSLSLCSCAAYGGVPSGMMGADATIRGLKSVLAEAPGTFIMQNEGLLVMAWPNGTKYAYTILCNGICPAFNSLNLNTTTMATLAKSLETGGWKYITSTQLPKEVVGILAGYTVEMVISGAQTLPTIFVIPAILIPTPMGQEVQS